ncbi:MAG TPA: hypothetical protein VHB21_13135 [Minicystis sp.]|nr:hypothetical protein [Minicystis sp.]
MSALGLVGLCTCGLDHVTVSADGKATVAKATLIEQLLGGALDFTGLDSIDFSEQFQNQGVTKDEVDGVHVSSFTLAIDAPKDGSFDFLDGIVVTASTDGEPTIEIASLDAVPKGAHQLTLNVDENADLAPYVTAPSMTIGATVKGHRPAEDTDISAHVELDVDVHVPGCN